MARLSMVPVSALENVSQDVKRQRAGLQRKVIAGTATFHPASGDSTFMMATELLPNLTTPVPRQGQAPQYSQASIVGLTCFLILIILATLIGNGLVVIAVWTSRKLRKSTNYFIVSLAVSDVLIAASIMTFRVHHNLNFMVWDLGPAVCQLWIFMDFLCSSASTANVALISIDRYLALSYPFKYPQMVNGKRCGIAIGMVWCFSGVLASLSFKDWSDNASLVHYPACRKLDKMYYSFATLLGIFFPLVILIVAYSLVFRVALRQALRIKAHSNVQNNRLVPQNNSNQDNAKRERSRQTRFLIRELKATKTLMIVVGTFLICWFPLFIVLLVDQHCQDCSVRLSPTLQQIIGITFVYTLPRLNSAVNPIIYSIFNREFRSVLCLLCGKVASVLPRTNVEHDTSPGCRGGICGPRGHNESTSDSSGTYEPNVTYYGFSLGNSRSPSVFTFKKLETCFYETSV